MRDVLLVCMPFGPAFSPSIGLSLLSAGLTRRQISNRILYFTMHSEAPTARGSLGAETLRQFRFIDAVVSGEGDIVFPELARRVLASEALAGLQGVRTRETIDQEFAEGRFPNAPALENLDDLPYPDHDDFFQQFGASRYDREWQPSVSFETSRGCWWGQHMHCTFCGLNGTSMTFRSKSARRALDELVAVTGRHPDCEDLSAHIARGPIPPADALPIAKQIAEALEAARPPSRRQARGDFNL